MPITPNEISAIGQGVAGLGKIVGGYFQNRKANKLLKGLQYPTEQLPAEEVENTNLLRQQAATGLPSEQYSKAMRDIQRQQLMAIMGAHDRRGGLGALAGIQQGTNDATLNLNSVDAQMRLANQGKLIAQNARVGAIRRDLFDKNIRQKYNRDYGYAMGLKGQGLSNIYGGLDQIGGAGMTALGGSQGYGQQNMFGGGGYNNLNLQQIPTLHEYPGHQ